MKIPRGGAQRAETHAWYEDNAAGQQRTLSAGNLSTVTSVVPCLQIADIGKPQAMTIQFDRERIAGTPGAYNAGIRARLSYGVGGARDTFFADWLDGGLMVLVCQALQVDAMAYAVNPDAPMDMGDLQMRVTVGVGHHPAPGIMPTYTHPLGDIAPAGVSGSITPPPFAKAVSIFGENQTTAFADPYPDLQLIQFQQGSAVPASRIYGGYLGGGSAAPILPDTNLILRNSSATDTIRATLMFHLGL